MQATEIKEKPIIFSTPMIKAILDGKKSQTRRVLKLRKGDTVGRIYDDKETEYIICDKYGDIVPIEFVSPYGVWDDRLWVKETHYRYGLWEPCENQDNETAYTFQPLSEEIRYFNNPPQVVLKGYGGAGWYKRPSIFMPRKASRITLEVTDLRIQMVQQISPEDAIAEGLTQELCEEVLVKAAGDLKPVEAYYVSDKDDCDLSGWLCYECAKKLKTSHGGAYICSGSCPESDGPAYCDSCGRPLFMSLTEYGIERELYLECDDPDDLKRYPATGLDAAIAGMIASGIGDLRNEHLGRLAQIGFATLWDSINASRGYSWESNPWVWAISFKMLKPEAK
jgi:hypothetical protein